MEFIVGIFNFLLEWFSGIWENIFATPLLELRYSQIVVLAIITYIGFRALGIVGRSAHKGSVAIGKAIKSAAVYVSPKGRASRTVCLHCGRTLDKCVCQSNKGLSFSKRLRKHKLELKLRRAAQK
jgi:polyferredoxin